MPDPLSTSAFGFSSRIGDPTPSVIQVPEARLLEAYQILSLDGRPAGPSGAANLLQYCRETGVRLDQCFALEQNDRFLLAFLAVPNPGRTALVFVSPPGPRPVLATSGRSLLSELIRLAHHRLDPHAIALAQVLLTPDEHALRPHFEHAGYRKLADLSYLETRVRARQADLDPRHPHAPAWEGLPWPPGTEIHTWSEANALAFQEALLASYRNSRDCPGLEQFRDVEDIIAGHRGQAGSFDPDLWTLVTVRGEPAAVLLLNAFPDGTTVELTYIGVSANHRRLGLANCLMLLARRQVARRGRQRFTLAVDEANLPALRLYERFGMRRTSRRTALIRPAGAKDWGDGGPVAPSPFAQRLDE